MTELSIIIVNWNCGELLSGCLHSVFQNSTPFSFEVIVVDNASGDDSVPLVRQKFPAVRILKNHTNRGFASACNRGSGAAKGKYLLFLNPDTRVHPGALRNAVSFMDAHPETGVMGCRTLNPDGSLQNTAQKFPTCLRIFAKVSGWGSRLKFLQPLSRMHRKTDYIAGSFLVIPRELFRRLGGFDDGFFLYGEDVDLCRRVQQAGLAVGYDRETVISHIGGGSFRDDAHRTAHFIAAYHKLYRKYRTDDQVKGLLRTIKLAIRMRYLCPLIFRKTDTPRYLEYRRFADQLQMLGKESSP